jgi:hypothetical protein
MLVRRFQPSPIVQTEPYQMLLAKKPNCGRCATNMVGGLTRFLTSLRFRAGFASRFFRSTGVSCA